ncbi:unnamed protein product [Rotaria magnacalcarata]
MLLSESNLIHKRLFLFDTLINSKKWHLNTIRVFSLNINKTVIVPRELNSFQTSIDQNRIPVFIEVLSCSIIIKCTKNIKVYMKNKLHEAEEL